MDHLAEFASDVVRLAARLLLVMAIFIPLERLFASRRQRILRPAFFTDLCWYVIGSFVPKLLLILPLSLLAWTLHRTVPSGFYAMMGALPVAVRAALALVAGEIGYYWGHRLMHEIPLLWRLHALHHSAEEMDWLVNTRAHPLDVFFGRLCALAPLYALGLAQPLGTGGADLVPVLIAFIGSLWGFFIHANINWRFGWLERVIATPAFHHWHHTNDGALVVNKNYSTMLPWVDLLFGTFHLPPNLPATYGINEKTPASLAGQMLHPLRPASARRASRPVAPREKAASFAQRLPGDRGIDLESAGHGADRR